ncbi:CoA activase [Candidatus Fermentibacteria bacterium]|nr:CoA activase [Candidatus Fermentibacteria bacterium]
MSRPTIGIDMGSISTKLVVMGEEGIEQAFYERHMGRPAEALAIFLSKIEDWPGCRAAFTGSAARQAAGVLDARPVNEVVALAAAVDRLLPEERSVIDIGGQDSKLLLFKKGRGTGGLELDDFAMNSICAAGTGSFLDQQALRLGLELDSLGERVLHCENPPRIAGRCSVFAKSDMIHLQQIGTPVEEIFAGLCYAVARNFKSSIASGKDFRSPVALTGGVAANQGIVKAFEEILGKGRKLFVPRNFNCLTAAGALFAATEKNAARLPEDFIERLGSRTPLPGSKDPLPSLEIVGSPPEGSSGTADPESGVFLGIDVGSISTNAVALSGRNGGLVAKRYLMTAGKPLEAVKKALSGLRKELPEDVEVLGAGTTGSGRYMVGDFVGADVVRNEITAQARAALEVDPEVDTVFEIGGQDSKYISLRNGRVVDFEMNKVCAAGTGSFLEEQAERLGMKISDFGDIALDASRPAPLGERCTVFMESDVIAHQAAGTQTDSIVAGLCYSIVKNYLNRVVGDKPVGNRIFFQGGTAFNRGVVAAFNAVLDDGVTVRVPSHHDVTGAIGAALLARENAKGRKSGFRGFSSLSEAGYSQETFVCDQCSNNCEIHRVSLADGRVLHYGSRCERYEQGRATARGKSYFPEKERLLLDGWSPPEDHRGIVVGIPRALWFWELFPFFRAFFEELGISVQLSKTSNPRLVHTGVENVAAESCFPVKIAHGHVADLLGKDVDYLFLPSIQRSAARGGFTESYNCPYIQASPYMIDAGLSLSQNSSAGVLKPLLDLSAPRGKWCASLREMCAPLGLSASAVRRACRAAEAAQKRYRNRLLKAGKKALAEASDDRPTLVVVSRPYNGSDGMVSMDIPRKLARLGANVIPMEYLDLPMDDASSFHPNMYWLYGQRILAAALHVRRTRRLNAVYLTNFGCGPDSFIQHTFAEVMGEKPYLTIEVDEHAADAGIVTRCEAFLDAISGRRDHGTSPYGGRMPGSAGRDPSRRLWVPLMSDASRMVVAAARKRGLDARAMPPTDARSVALGRRVTTGRECYPAIITAGNMLSTLEREDPERTTFFMATACGPCRFGQYCSFHRLMLDKCGYRDVPIVTASSSDSYTSIKGYSALGLQLDLLRGTVAADVLKRALLRLRPYELHPGRMDELYTEHVRALAEAMESGSRLKPVLRGAAESMGEVPLSDRSRPVVYVFGEIYIRNDPYANDFTEDHVERLGGEVMPTPIMEWLEFVNLCYLRRSLKSLKPVSAARAWLKGRMMRLVRESFEEPFGEILGDREPSEPAEILRSASPYMRQNPGGEAILSVGAPVSLARKKAIDGAINILPFTCLPGTIVTAISKSLRRDFPDLPWLNLAFDGQEDTDNLVRLEAFMYQVRRNHDREAGRTRARRSKPFRAAASSSMEYQK